MIQARKDVSASSKEQRPEEQTLQSIPQRIVRTVPSDQRHEIIIANSADTPTIILSEGSSLGEGSTLQHRLSLGTQLQHVLTPTQVSATSTAITETQIPINSRCVVTSTQDVCGILVSATTTSSLHPVELQNTVVNVNTSTVPQLQTIGNITSVPLSAPRIERAAGFTQNLGPKLVYHRIPSSNISGSGLQRVMLVDSSGNFGSSNEVAKVHSYSLASAPVSSLSSNTAPGQTLQAPSIQHKAIIATSHNQLRTAVKRTLSTSNSNRTETVSSVNCVNDIVSRLSVMNKLLSGLTISEGKISSIPSSPKSKRIKLEKITNKDVLIKRKKLTDYFAKKLKHLQMKYYNQQVEYFFLKTGSNMVDYVSFRKKLSTDVVEYLRENRFDPHDEITSIVELLSRWPSSLSSGASSFIQPGLPNDHSQTSKPITSNVSSHNQCVSRVLFSQSSSVKLIDSSHLASQTTVTKSVKQPVITHKQSSKHNSISTVYDSQIGSQEEIVERAKQEAYVMQRVGDLRKEGLWSFKRLPKVAESPRIKAHWDYLLEEMVWLATDFAQERKWKKAAAKKCARMITKYFQEKEIKAEKAEKEEQLKMKKVASIMAREIKQFWSNIEKLVEYKQQTWLEEKRKKVLDVHLNFIVDQTEKYSSWLTQGMNRNFKDSPSSSRASSPCPDSPLSILQKSQHDISDFEPDSSASDDEETIKKEEEDIDVEEQSKEIALLQQESEMSLEEFLDTLPQEVLESHSQLNEEDKFSASNETNQGVFSEDETNIHKNSLDDDVDFEFSEDEEDDEQTILEQEKVEKYIDHEEEIKDLEAENELSIDELREKYSGAYANDFKMEGSEKHDEDSLVPSENESDISVDESSEEDVSEIGQKDQLSKPFNEEDDGKSSPSKEISDIAATAESFQPKGNTLSTTQVFTKVPFLLKHQLREYQHIGLDWLNAMYDKKLNGILADEMGLGKTIQTISVLAHLACDKGIWGPHLIVVPTSVMLNWEMEFKKWCPAFKILTYYGTPKERKQKRVGWTKPNAFHVCITSYKLVVQDHQSFRRKKWKYLILDEAQHIKNFKSQRWQMLLNFQSTHRLLLTGTPLQNNLMELWSLMHFLMPNVFQSHREFREWFVNPVTGMIEGSHEYNESLIKRLHKVLRPFLLRRLKSEVEKQLPKKYEHILICRLSKRQRYLYDDFMAQTKTKETLATGNFMSVINILMQLRKVCNHPNMFEERPTVSPFQMPGILFYTSSLAYTALEYDAFKHVSLQFLNLLLADLELSLTAFAAHRVKKFQTPSKLIVEIDNLPEPPPPCPAVKMRVNFCNSQGSGRSSPVAAQTRTVAARIPVSAPNRITTPATLPPRFMVLPGQPTTPVSRTVTPATTITNHPVISQPEQYTLQLVQPGTVASLAPLGGLTLQLQPASPGGNRVQCIQSLIGGIGRMVTATTGAQWLITTSVANSVSEQPQLQTTVSTVSAQPSLPITTASSTPIVLSTNIATATVIPQVQKMGNPSVSAPFITTFNRPPSSSPSSTSITSQTNHNKPVGRVAPLNVHPPSNSSMSNVNHIQPSKGPVVHSLTKPNIKADLVQSEKKHSLFYLDSLVVQREQDRKNSLKSLARINNFRCAACPIYGADLVEAVTSINSLSKNNTNQSFRGEGCVSCNNAKLSTQKPELYWDYTKSLSNLISSPEERIVELIETIKRFVFVIAYVAAPPIQLHISHPPPSNINTEKNSIKVLQNFLSPKCAFLHPVISNMKTQFPELRLIQYDCGKLQRLAHLLQELKSNQHRVLIFTQMTRMLDILEQFLNYHGHTYLRLDGLTKVEQRQALMERFNADKRIFCFILSTRSGGIGVNLTGADTVIFYDSDWNPTMDAQAQDRCHRIGQTRDVHIYRLISEKTVEENILKKANQKRILGDLAIEGGNFTTAFFKKNTIHELFGIEMLEDISKVSHEFKKMDDSTEVENDEKFSPSQLEQALGMAEEESDLQAAKTAHAEAAAELAEFDESIPLDTDSREIEEKSPAEEELEKLMDQLTPVEKYAVQFLESLQEPVSLEQLKLAEEEIEAQKKDWELGHLKALKEEEERRASRLADEDALLFCSHEASNQVHRSSSRSKRSKGRDSLSNKSQTNTSTAPKRRSKRINIKKEQNDNSFLDSEESNDYDMKESLRSISKIDTSDCNFLNGPTNGDFSSKRFKQALPNAKIDWQNSKNFVKHTPNPVIIKPFSNPNLVIRTRRASAIEAEEKSKSESESELSVPSPKNVNSTYTGQKANLVTNYLPSSSVLSSPENCPNKLNSSLAISNEMPLEIEKNGI